MRRGERFQSDSYSQDRWKDMCDGARTWRGNGPFPAGRLPSVAPIHFPHFALDPSSGPHSALPEAFAWPIRGVFE